MASGSYIRSRVICPFYCTDESRQPCIKCEDPLRYTSITLGFTNKFLKKNYMERYCISDYADCEIFVIANKKYKDD